MSGTFQLLFKQSSPNIRSSDGVDTRGWWHSSAPIGSTDADLIAGLAGTNLEYYALRNAGPIVGASITFENSVNIPCFLLDGTDLVSLHGLPVGFVVSFIELSGGLGQTNISGTVLAQIENFSSGFVTSFNLSPTPLLNGIGNQLSAFQAALSQLVLSVTGNTTGIMPPPGAVRAAEFSAFTIIGNYDIVNFSWTISTPNAQLNSGDTVTISDPTGGLGGIQTVTIQYVDENGVFHEDTMTPTLQTAYFIIFIITWTNNPISIYVAGVGNGTQFTGTVILGQLPTTNFTDGSGIYELVAGKTCDTLYDHNGDTIDFKIPNPFAKTGFIGG